MASSRTQPLRRADRSPRRRLTRSGDRVPPCAQVAVLDGGMPRAAREPMVLARDATLGVRSLRG